MLILQATVTFDPSGQFHRPPFPLLWPAHGQVRIFSLFSFHLSPFPLQKAGSGPPLGFPRLHRSPPLRKARSDVAARPPVAQLTESGERHLRAWQGAATTVLASTGGGTRTTVALSFGWIQWELPAGARRQADPRRRTAPSGGLAAVGGVTTSNSFFFFSRFLEKNL